MNLSILLLGQRNRVFLLVSVEHEPYAKKLGFSSQLRIKNLFQALFKNRQRLVNLRRRDG